MFNLDIASSNNSSIGNSENAIRQRWIGRFKTVLLDQCFHPKDAEWSKNWTDTGVSFKTSYMLRDFKFSQMIYGGFKDTGREEEMLIDREYYDTMRRTFIEADKQYELFQDPVLSWDVAASQGNDGALRIIEQLSKIAPLMWQNREEQFRQQVADAMAVAKDIIEPYYISEDVDKILEDNVRKLKCIIRELDFTCNRDNYFFGHLIQALQLTEAETLRLIHRLVQGPELVEKVTNFEDNELIRKQFGDFEGCKTDDEKWALMLKRYMFRTREEASAYFERKGISVASLFAANVKKKQNATIIAEQVLELWRKKLRSVEFMNKFTGDYGFDPNVMSDLVEQLIQMSLTQHLEEVLSESIAEYVNVVNVAMINEHFIADALASSVSEFVMSFGEGEVRPEELRAAETVARNYDLPPIEFITAERKSSYTEEELTELFTELFDSPRVITAGFEHSYSSWIEYMLIAFTAHLDVPADFDPDANTALWNILTKMEA